MKRYFIFSALLIIQLSYHAQKDTILLKEIEITAEKNVLKPITGVFLSTGKNLDVVNFKNRTVTYAEKYGRQLFSKIPGAFIYDMDGTGNQVNFSIRGLDPHRMWEFNVRKDGIMTNTDIYGYPASHYNVPMEAIDRIELVKGTAALQYGAQFGGMLNYITKKPDSTKVISYENSNTIGTYNLVSTFHRLSGTKNKFSYNIWFAKKSNNGYRKNARSLYDAENVTLTYQFTPKTSLTAEWTHSNFLVQLPGPLTDSMFKLDPRMATRSRNYYTPSIHVAFLKFNTKITDRTTLEYNISSLWGERNSVMFDKPANVPDTINRLTGKYANRQVDLDFYTSFSTELRMLHNYTLFNLENTLLAGVQGINNFFVRKQQGKGTTGTDYDLTLIADGWGRDLTFDTKNIALFVENKWAVTKNLSLNTGVRYENGTSNLKGKIKNYPENELPAEIKHQFPLFGASAEYRISKNMLVNAGISQAYRPVLLKDITPASVYEKNDKVLKDAYGHIADASFKGVINTWKWDITAFYIAYNNRMGTNTYQDTAGNYYVVRKNIGNSESKGVELYIEKIVHLNKHLSFMFFNSTAYIDARYKKAVIRSGNNNIDISGNKVESAPEWISRTNLTVRYKLIEFSVLYSYVAESFADALNTKTPSATGAVGLVPAYQLVDASLTWTVSEHIAFTFNINNLFDEAYFTKRPQFYPGPGIWPSDGRTISLTLRAKI